MFPRLAARCAFLASLDRLVSGTRRLRAIAEVDGFKVNPSRCSGGFCQGSRQNRPNEQYAYKSGNHAVMISRTKPDTRK
jgi:hypothetical protein